MKNLKNLLLLVALLPSLAFAQPGLSKAVPLDVKLGLKGGLNFARLDGSVFNTGAKTGYHIGAFASVGVKKIGGQIEIVYGQNTFSINGAKVVGLLKNPITDSLKSGNLSVSNINIPILFNLKLFSNATIQLGPQYTGVLSVSDKNNMLKQPDNFFQNSDVSGVVGLWLNLPMNINAGARYIFGLSDQNLSSIGSSWKRRTIQIHVGYSFL